MLSNVLANPFDANQNLAAYEIFERLPCGLVILNAQGRITWFNPAAQALLACELDNAIWRDVIHQAFAPREDDGHEVSLKDGRRVSVAISSLTHLPGELVTLTDLTPTRAFQQEQANHQQLLVLGRMTAQLAHQIRTPLASAMLSIDHAQHYANDPVKLQTCLERIKQCHTSIEKQIQDLLIFVRGDNIQRVDVNLQSWSKRLEVQAQGITLGTETTLIIYNDLPAVDHKLHEESLLGAILNLIHNAVEAAAQQIVLSLRFKHQALHIAVEDNGSGMSEEIKSQAFSAFYTTKAQGVGLGLAVVKAVVSAHGGKLLLQSTLQQGCCITIELP